MKKLSLKTRRCLDVGDNPKRSNYYELESCSYCIENETLSGIQDFGNCVVLKTKRKSDEETTSILFFITDGRLCEPETIADFLKVYEAFSAWETADIVEYNGKYWKGSADADPFVEDIPF